MSTPIPPARKYRTWAKTRPETVWSPALKKAMKVKGRVKLFRQNGYQCSTIKAGKICTVPPDSKNRAFVGARMPFEVSSPRAGIFHLCIHRVQYADRTRNPLTARVQLHLPGGVIEEFQSSSVVAAPVLAIQAWPCRAKHLPRLVLGNVKAAHNIITEAGGSSVVLLAAAASDAAVRSERIVLPYDTVEKRWVCSTCGRTFATAADLAAHDGAPQLVTRPRRLLLSAQLEPTAFVPPEFDRRNLWKKRALNAIDKGDTEAAINMAPTMRRKEFADQLRARLGSLPSHQKP